MLNYDIQVEKKVDEWHIFKKILIRYLEALKIIQPSFLNHGCI